MLTVDRPATAGLTAARLLMASALAAALAPAAARAQRIECPAVPQQVAPETEVQVRASVGRLARVTGGDLSLGTRRTVNDLLARLPEAQTVYLEQMLFAAYCSAVRDDPSLTRSQQADRLQRYGREMRAALAAARAPAPTSTPRREPAAPPARPRSDRSTSPGAVGGKEARDGADDRARAQARARDSLAFLGYAVTDTAAFFALVKAGKVDVVRHFLNGGMSPNLRDDGWPPLATAARNGDSAMVATLLRAGALPARGTDGDVRPLSLAAGTGRVGVVRLLLAAGADPGYVDDHGDHALFAAALAGDTATLALLLRTLPAERQRTLLAGESVGLFGGTPLGAAAQHGHVDAVRLLLRAGAPPALPADDPPLCGAVEWRNTNVPSDDAGGAAAHRARYLRVIRLLVEEGGAPVNAPCKGHNSPRSVLVEPAVMVDTAVVDYLLARGADPNRSFGWDGPPLVAAIMQRGMWDGANARGAAAVRYLLAHGARPDAPSSEGTTALMWAAYRGWIEVVETLLAAGAGVNARDTTNATALHWAARPSNATAVRLLLAHGADVRVRDKRGHTALMRLVQSELDYGEDEPPGAREVAELFLRAGVDRAARDAEGRTAADLARAHRYCAVAALLGAACGA
jgi:ankyrin repeat protein